MHAPNTINFGREPINPYENHHLNWNITWCWSMSQPMLREEVSVGSGAFISLILPSYANLGWRAWIDRVANLIGLESSCFPHCYYLGEERGVFQHSCLIPTSHWKSFRDAFPLTFSIEHIKGLFHPRNARNSYFTSWLIKVTNVALLNQGP